MIAKFDWQKHEDSYKIEYKGFRAVIDKWGWAVYKGDEKQTWGTATGRKAKDEIESWLFVNTD